MKSEMKKPDRDKSNRERTSKEKSNREKSIREKANKEKKNKEKAYEERSDKERLDEERSAKERHGKGSPETETSEVRNADGEKSEADKKNMEMPDKDKQNYAEAVMDGRNSENGESASEESALGKTSASQDNAAKTGETMKASGIMVTGSSAEADEPEKTDSDVDNSEKGSTEQAQKLEFDDRDEEGEDWENDDLQDDWEEESTHAAPWSMALVFLGMIFAAACICVMLWVFTHSDKREEENQNVFAGATVTPGTGDVYPPSETGTPSLEDQGGQAATGSDSGENDAPDLNRVTTRDGRVIIFTECDDMVTPKEYVNLRTEPSTTQGEATVGCRLNNGEVAHRTGISEEMGWSRVEYDDQILYVVSSFVNVVTDDQTSE